MNRILTTSSMKITKLGYYDNVVGSPYLHKLYFIDHGLLSVYDMKNGKKKQLDIKCSRITLSPAGNRLYVISKDQIRLISTYTNKVVKRIPISNVKILYSQKMVINLFY